MKESKDDVAEDSRDIMDVDSRWNGMGGGKEENRIGKKRKKRVNGGQ